MSVKVSLQTETKFSYAWEQLDVHKLSSLFADSSHLRIFSYADYVVSPLKHRFNGTNIWYISFSPPILRWQNKVTVRVTRTRARQLRCFDLTPGKVKRFLSSVAPRLVLRSAHPLIQCVPEALYLGQAPIPMLSPTHPLLLHSHLQ